MKNINDQEINRLRSTLNDAEVKTDNHQISVNIQTCFSQRILNWYDSHGRKNLPWQKNITPYRVWISEIMLQQTQVATVIPFFNAFMGKFPTVEKLAQSTEDEVLHSWSGLGYYSRARHLRSSAIILTQEHNGKLPETVEALVSLPGIGRSTAGAIMAISMNRPAAILDGNVKRVLTRYFTIAGWPGTTRVEKTLWQVAEQLLPKNRFGHYTQALMDMGATVCKRGKPLCFLCPLNPDCPTFHSGLWHQYPAPKPKKTLPVKKTFMLIFSDANGKLLLQKRKKDGVWKGLWSFPEASDINTIETITKKYLTDSIKQQIIWPAFRHTFSHYHLEITPVVVVDPSTIHSSSNEDEQGCWYQPGDKTVPGGFPAPVKKLVSKFQQANTIATT